MSTYFTYFLWCMVMYQQKYDRSLNPSQLTSVATKKVNFPLGHLPFVHIKVCHGLCKCWKNQRQLGEKFPSEYANENAGRMRLSWAASIVADGNENKMCGWVKVFCVLGTPMQTQTQMQIQMRIQMEMEMEMQMQMSYWHQRGAAVVLPFLALLLGIKFEMKMTRTVRRMQQCRGPKWEKAKKAAENEGK